MIRRLGSAALAALAVGATVTTVVPQHAASLALLAAGTLVVVTAAFLLILAGPLVTTDPPTTALDVERRAGAPTLEPQGLRDARRDLAARATPGSLPAPVHRRLVAAGVLATVPEPGPGAQSNARAVAALVDRLLDDPEPIAHHGEHR